jgi:ATP-dependent RNA helicase DOB1
MADCGIATDVEEYVDSFCPDLMEVVIAWCRGAKFADISQSKGKDKKKGHLFEGSIVRALRRLEELLRQVEGALKTVGDNELAEKFDKGRELIKRDIVFAASLFL